MGKILVPGAAGNPDRYSCMATKSLIRNGYEAVPVGFKSGFIKELEILTGMPEIDDVDTVLLYLDKKKQQEYYNYIIGLNPLRVIFNPGAENPELQSILCALIMINNGVF